MCAKFQVLIHFASKHTGRAIGKLTDCRPEIVLSLLRFERFRLLLINTTYGVTWSG